MIALLPRSDPFSRGRSGFDGDGSSMSSEPVGCETVNNASVNINAKKESYALAA